MNNLLLEGFSTVPTPLDISTFEGRTTSNRGKIIACDLWATRENTPADTYRISLSVGGQQIVENASNVQYQHESFPGDYKLIPLEINDGQTFQLLNDLTNEDADVLVSVIFIREGFSWDYQWKNRGLNSYKLVETATFTTAIGTPVTGTIPKNRGKCVGFAVYPVEFRPTFDNDSCFLTFSVGGVELIKDVPQPALYPIGTRPYKRLFLPLLAGDTWELQMIQTATVATRFVDVVFFFEKED